MSPRCSVPCRALSKKGRGFYENEGKRWHRDRQDQVGERFFGLVPQRRRFASSVFLSFSLSRTLVQDYLGKQRTGQWSPAFWMDLMYRGGTGGMGLVKVPERENCHPQDLSFLSVIPRVSNFIHPVARFSLASGNRLRDSGSGLDIAVRPYR